MSVNFSVARIQICLSLCCQQTHAETTYTRPSAHSQRIVHQNARDTNKNITLKTRSWPNFNFGFGTESATELGFGLVSVSVGCTATSFGFGRICEWIRRWMTKIDLISMSNVDLYSAFIMQTSGAGCVICILLPIPLQSPLTRGTWLLTSGLLVVQSQLVPWAGNRTVLWMWNVNRSV